MGKPSTLLHGNAGYFKRSRNLPQCWGFLWHCHHVANAVAAAASVVATDVASRVQRGAARFAVFWRLSWLYKLCKTLEAEMLCDGMAMRGAQCASTTLAAACHYVPQLHEGDSLKQKWGRKNLIRSKISAKIVIER